ncbi:hypothetical protein [Rhizobium leguminosarum]|uniref:hypothetical protein n=1 Tax=Rhizobium leguminosarum TaxID=384 RepID=UPI001C9857F8|nr:hypothetical protein [Rhizobium leguminosarum]MBY5585635.1 hypothetical protein [Rhizobium leguminosarum]
MPTHAQDATRKKLFNGADLYFPLLERTVPRILTHRYTFISDDWYKDQVDGGKLSAAEMNAVVAVDLLEKAHLAAATSLIRILRWADAVCLMYETKNYPGFAGALRGLIENGGDTVDGLLNIPAALAAYHHRLKEMLAGKMTSGLADCSALEHMLDHYIHAGWAGKKSDPVRAAKANAEYVALIEKVVPSALSLYHRLCAIVHPSNQSVGWLFDFDELGDRRIALTMDDAAKIDAILVEFPSAIGQTFSLTCNCALLTLRVLHKFPLHPKIPELKKVDWSPVPVGRDVEQLLRN